MENTNKESNKKKINLLTCSFIFIGLVIVLILIIFLWPKETYNSTKDDSTSIASLSCQAANPNEPFFYSADAISPLYKIIISFDNNGLSKIFFSYSANFPSNSIAYSVYSDMEARYNLLLQRQNIDIKTYYPNFQNIGTQVKAEISTSSKDYTTYFGTMVFSKKDTTRDINEKTTPTQLLQDIEMLGYSCQYAD